jgi:peptidoglycan-associated lipoprotein
MNLRIFYFLLLFVLITIENAWSQSKRLERADAAYQTGEYFLAIDLYKDAYNAVSDKDIRTEIVFKTGECYRKINDSRQAEVWYKKAINRNYSNPLVYLYYANALQMNEKFDDAIIEYQRYSELRPEDSRGRNGLISCQLAKEWMANPTAYQISEMQFFNSRQSDFSPAYAKEDYSVVYFTTSRKEVSSKETHGATGEKFSDIFMSSLDRRGSWSTPASLGDQINSVFDEGTPSLSGDYTTMYFTSCKAVKRKANGCQIYVSQRSGEKWGRPELVELAADSIVVAHPAISPDELTLYFVSDMDGGQGGKDIWKVSRKAIGDSWGNPENLGPEINTRGDEVFPYVHHDGTLYFSSNGHIGMGGLDIFKASKEPSGKWKIENMRYPVNSPADDFGIAFEKESERGFFSSNRARRGTDNIFSFYLPPLVFNVSGNVIDEKTEKAIPEVLVKMVGSDGLTQEMTTSTEGYFRFMLRPAVDYIFIASKEGYLTGKGRETTKGIDRSMDFRVGIQLSSIASPIDLPNIFYDFARWELRPESMVNLDRLVETLNDNPNVTIELASHTDARGTAASNIELSQKRAQSVVDYLISKGIAADRLAAKGYGKSVPKTVDMKTAREFTFLKEGDILTEQFIERLGSEELRESAHQINRRTEFKVLRTNYVPRAR